VFHNLFVVGISIEAEEGKLKAVLPARFTVASAGVATVPRQQRLYLILKIGGSGQRHAPCEHLNRKYRDV
jgi:hypothetical protein